MKEHKINESIVAQKGPYAIEVKEGKTYYWCQCGRSNKQPFCDGSHKGTNFNPIPYKAKENIENLVHPDDFHIRVPFKAVKNNPVFTVGKDIGVERFMKGTK